MAVYKRHQDSRGAVLPLIVGVTLLLFLAFELGPRAIGHRTPLSLLSASQFSSKAPGDAEALRALLQRMLAANSSAEVKGDLKQLLSSVLSQPHLLSCTNATAQPVQLQDTAASPAEPAACAPCICPELGGGAPPASDGVAVGAAAAAPAGSGSGSAAAASAAAGAAVQPAAGAVGGPCSIVGEDHLALALARPGVLSPELEEGMRAWATMRDLQQEEQWLQWHIEDLGMSGGSAEDTLAAQNQQKEIQAQMQVAGAAYEAAKVKVPSLTDVTGLLPVARLNTKLYKGRPRISILLNYYKRPAAIEGLVAVYSQCKHALPSEFLVNVDNPEEAAEWVKHVYPNEGFVVPVFSYNLHEARGYNRLASLARGDVVVIVQDDLLPPTTDNCTWAVDLMRLFDKFPRLGAVGMRNACIQSKSSVCEDAYRPSSPDWFVYEEPELKLDFQFAMLADYGPMAVRRDAYMDIGGIDETYGKQGECAIASDYDVTARLWEAGWMVGHLPLVTSQDAFGEGGTHVPGGSCWSKNGVINSHHRDLRHGAVYVNISRMAAQANLDYLRPKDSPANPIKTLIHPELTKTAALLH